MPPRALVYPLDYARFVYLATANSGLSKGYDLVTRLQLTAEADPDPAIASKRQAQKPPRYCIALEFHDAVA
jgi:hypothetical protein